MVKDHSDSKETRCHHIGCSFRLAARVLLYASPLLKNDITNIYTEIIIIIFILIFLKLLLPIVIVNIKIDSAYGFKINH